MDDREKQRIEYKERNDRNKAWRKRVIIFYVGVFGLLVALVAACLLTKYDGYEVTYYATITVMIIIALWCGIGNFFIKCPHCDDLRVLTAPFSERCPYCGTSLIVYPDLELPDTKEKE